MVWATPSLFFRRALGPSLALFCPCHPAKDTSACFLPILSFVWSHLIWQNDEAFFCVCSGRRRVELHGSRIARGAPSPLRFLGSDSLSACAAVGYPVPARVSPQDGVTCSLAALALAFFSALTSLQQRSPGTGRSVAYPSLARFCPAPRSARPRPPYCRPMPTTQS